MKRVWGIALVLAGCLVAAPVVCAQNPADDGAALSKTDKKADKKAKKAAQNAPQPAAPQTPAPADANAFPTDTSDVPVLPNSASGASMGTYSDADTAAASLPAGDLDPVKSPDQPEDDSGSVQELHSSSSVKGLDSLLPGPGDPDTGRRKRKSDVVEGPPTETAKDDITVAKYYLDQKNWKAAQSRFQSALVLSPEEPEVYWGLAESARHLGNFAEARANYEKVMEYDPDSRHAKDAKKILKDPEMAGK
jgi:tetratricopeptide (TPR) repeat protein